MDIDKSIKRMLGTIKCEVCNSRPANATGVCDECEKTQGYKSL